jgi:hypothetical protein
LRLQPTYSNGISSLLLRTQCTQFLIDARPFPEDMMTTKICATKEKACHFILLHENLSFYLITVTLLKINFI